MFPKSQPNAINPLRIVAATGKSQGKRIDTKSSPIADAQEQARQTHTGNSTAP